MSEKEVEEVWSEIILFEDEKREADRQIGKKFRERILVKKVEMLTVEELTKARKENLLVVRDVEDLQERVMTAKLEIERVKLANEKFVEDKVSQPSNDRKTPREDTSLEMGSIVTNEEMPIDGNNIELIEERMITKEISLLEEGADDNIRANDSDGFRLGEEASMSCYSNHSHLEEALVKNTELLNHMNYRLCKTSFLDTLEAASVPNEMTRRALLIQALPSSYHEEIKCLYDRIAKESGVIDILIGQDFKYLLEELGRIKRIWNEPCAIKYPLGWAVVDDDRKYHCIVWRDGDERANPKKYEWPSLIFGDKPIPDLSQSAVRFMGEKICE
ncbi:unnamed protein product [Lepeophtheirus salmonis]|uniref:(salmon louse) hypothetical protein n=1 Tax=Lepeophtheirus salmonis TaxID=72036 RepID=A0A7R8H2I8_LEPSM|nr:unnamed protein product [Lepeophtheirus salmonis]CAF2815486.1 unnamed protein product [Lepeophtheirus salmonis]